MPNTTMMWDAKATQGQIKILILFDLIKQILPNMSAIEPRKVIIV